MTPAMGFLRLEIAGNPAVKPEHIALSNQK
jgi:hypothetical protein